MSMHQRWDAVPIATLVNNVLAIAQMYGEAEVFVHGPLIRIEKPGTFTAREYDDHCGSIKHGTSRNAVTAALLAAFTLAVAE